MLLSFHTLPSLSVYVSSIDTSKLFRTIFGELNQRIVANCGSYMHVKESYMHENLKNNYNLVQIQQINIITLRKTLQAFNCTYGLAQKPKVISPCSNVAIFNNRNNTYGTFDLTMFSSFNYTYTAWACWILIGYFHQFYTEFQKYNFLSKAQSLECEVVAKRRR